MIVESLGIVLQDKYDVCTAESRKQANTVLHSLENIPSLALVDLGLPPKPHSPEEGFALINDLLGLKSDIKILVLSGQSEQMNIQHALTLGAVDFIPKPCDISLLKARLQHQIMMLQAEQAQQDTEKNKENLLGESPAIETLRSLIQKFAETPYPVLIEGESGSGKELVAENLHKLSPRFREPFLILNCAAFSPELLEAQLFGHSKGAFTGATADKSGFFEVANKGSLFLDEIGDLPLDLQSKLLRVLENGEYYRLGETQSRKSNARIIAATNRDLKESLRTGEFRQDLYHRLSVLTINVPPLQERGNDCLILLDHFRRVYSVSANPFVLSDGAEQLVKEYSFPGNVRELRNIVIRLGAKYPGKTVSAEELNAEFETNIVSSTYNEKKASATEVRQELLGQKFRLDDTLSEWEKRYINTALELSKGNLSKAARLLGINRTTLYSRMQRLSMGEEK
ncbi:MAG: sigma-54-dependent Fis family transcriptional regulator [Gammaproteobacteria bacterium]|nr:sigma-54-dependent Fis family transcriptional regulator [Gammaproteobacteria bacterium]